MSRLWTDGEIQALVRNYNRYGTDMSKWDEPIERNPHSIRAKACDLHIRRANRHASVLSETDQRRLRYVCDQLCERMGIEMHVLSREVSAISGQR